jgi:hypothetical protein
MKSALCALLLLSAVGDKAAASVFFLRGLERLEPVHHGVELVTDYWLDHPSP